ncbi:MAG: EAL domain-containing protein, partial [Lachnospiraceae bacterium]|nr:EAL domain-containing protein [Lachnospiraceae bacterium]
MNPDRKKQNISIDKVTVFFLIVFVILFLLYGLFSYRQMGQMLISQNKETGMALAAQVAERLDGDALETIRSESDPEYKVMHDILDGYNPYAYVEYIYTMRMDGDTLRFVVDADPEDPAACLEEYPLERDMLPVFDGKVCCDTQVTHDRWGSYFSAYAPVFNSAGNVAGFVGVDVSIQTLDSYLKDLMIHMGVLLTVFAGIFMIFYFTASIAISHRDSLTNLPNYMRLIQIGKKLKNQDRLTNYVAVIINIKGFKYINSERGYDYGNQVLISLGQYLKQKMHPFEYISRTGNDNFILLIKNQGFEDRLEIVKQDNQNPSPDLKKGKLPCNIRCCVYRISEEDDIEHAVSFCQAALRQLRNEKGQDFLFYKKELYDNLLKEGAVVSSFHTALNDHEFLVYYQPKVDIKTGRLCGAEALVRWRHNGELISPGIFIPLLEREGLIQELDFYVLNMVCADLAEWKAEGLEVVPISSNFSKLHLKSSSFADDILMTLQLYQTDSHMIVVELTESSGYSDLAALKGFVGRMSESNIHVSIDDFGTGYSSLSLIGDINMDEIKLDKSFVDRIFDGSENGATLVKNVIYMINDLGKETICEGVETAEQVEFLMKTSCRIIQGYYFDRPLPKEEFVERL